MKLPKIMVYQDDNPHCVNWTTYSAHLAKQFGAHLTGVFVGQDPHDLQIFDDALEKAIQQNIDHETLPANISRAQFEQVIKQFHLETDFKIINDKTSIVLRREARFFNLVIIGQPDTSPDSMQDEKGALSHLLLGGGRPVIVVPHAYPSAPSFSRITIAWDGGRESTRALFDSLPYIKGADSIEVVTIKTDEDNHRTEIARTDEVSALLNSMDIPNKTKIVAAHGNGCGHLILKSAQNHRSNLIVMGAYGHSRLREMVLGSATQNIIQNSNIPVFMSH